MNKIKLRKLDPRGMAHFVMPLAVVMVVGLVGTYMLVASKAATCKTVHATTANGKPLPAETVCQKSEASIDAQNKANAAKARANAKPRTPQNPTPAQARSQARTNSGASDTAATNAAPTAPPSNDPEPTSTPVAPVAAAAAKYVRPNGNIVIVTYRDTAIASQDGHDRRLGGVKVKVARAGGPNGCTTHTSGTASTNTHHYLDAAKKVLDTHHGTAHFKNCNTGQFTVSLVGLKGYTAVSKSSRTFTLNNNETKTVSFVLGKVVTYTTAPTTP
jgi:hypothetical protein